MMVENRTSHFLLGCDQTFQNESNNIFIANLQFLSLQIHRYFSILILLFGTVGNLLNCLALSQRILRSNPCAALFLASSIANLIALISGVLVRLLAGWGADLTETISWICKVRIYVLYVSRTIAPWLITMATIDRWLSSSADVRRRQMSTLKNAQRGMVVITITTILLHTPVFYCFQSNLTYTPLKCYARTTLCRVVYDLHFAFVCVILPSILMFTFGLMTIVNVRQSKLHRIYPMTNSIQISSRAKKLDRHLQLMLLIEVIFGTLFSLPQAIQMLHLNIIQSDQRSTVDNMRNNFILQVFFLLAYLTNGMPFYIYTLAGGSVFRQALFRSIQTIFRKFVCA